MVASYQLRVAGPLRSHRSRFRSDLIFWVIFLVGFILRLRRYLQDRGLMHDDAQLASNIFSRSFSQLLRPLNIGDQAAPVGFLILQKTSTTIFGHGELALRLVPFLASVVVLPIFFVAVRRLASPAIALMGLGWMALAEPLVRYSSEAKQYSTDVLWATVMLAPGCQCRCHRGNHNFDGSRRGPFVVQPPASVRARGNRHHAAGSIAPRRQISARGRWRPWAQSGSSVSPRIIC